MSRLKEGNNEQKGLTNSQRDLSLGEEQDESEVSELLTHLITIVEIEAQLTQKVWRKKERKHEGRISTLGMLALSPTSKQSNFCSITLLLQGSLRAIEEPATSFLSRNAVSLDKIEIPETQSL